MTEALEGGHFQALPDELLQSIFEYLTLPSLNELRLVCHRFYDVAISHIWKGVELIDCRAWHRRSRVRQDDGDYSDIAIEDWADYEKYSDEHDDSPMIKKLLVLARNPHIASKVQVLMHRCHLPTPAIFSELPWICFNGRTLSRDPRTLQLLQLAINNMTNVHTLRIVYGHWRLTQGILHGFFYRYRQRRNPVRRLWLESCALEGFPGYPPDLLDLSNLQSIRIRRLRLTPLDIPSEQHFALSRGNPYRPMHSGVGAEYDTSIHYREFEYLGSKDSALGDHDQPTESFTDALFYDGLIFKELPQVDVFLNQASRNVLPPYQSCPGGAGLNPAETTLAVFCASTTTLTSLTLDWVLLNHEPFEGLDDVASSRQRKFFEELSLLRFPNLRAFQLRNAISDHTRILPEICLLDGVLVDFIEAHSNLQCLGWPMARFFPDQRSDPLTVARVRNVIFNLSRTILDLRVDHEYLPYGEPLTDEDPSPRATGTRMRRRRFISDFASHMARVESIKLEGCIPRDEKREVIRALNNCPLKKIVLIGASFPVGNTWGVNGESLAAIEENGLHTNALLEEEHFDAIIETAARPPTPPSPSWKFIPEYGWPPGPPMIHTIATHHAETVTELKFCGYTGSPILWHPTAITQPMLYPLKHFHNLRQLVLSLHLVTFFDFDFRDEEIIRYWVNSRDCTSTALVPFTSFDEARQGNPWQKELMEKYAPDKLAERVAAFVGPCLSEVAKARPRGVRVRAGFCLGVVASDIFDLDIRVGQGNEVLEYKGPREEGERERWREKMNNRRWF